MAIGSCYCGKIRVELNGQPLKSVSVTYKIQNIVDKVQSFALGTLPLSRLSQAHRGTLFLPFRRQHGRVEGLRQSEGASQNSG